MLSEAIERIRELGVQAANPTHLTDTADGRQKVYATNKGELLHVPIGAPVRRSQVYTLDDLIRCTQTLPLHDTFAFWHNSSFVRLVLDETDRRDLVVLKLEISRQFGKLLLQDAGEDRYSQSEFVRMLHRTMGVDAATVAKFRRLDFKVIQMAEGEHEHGKDRMGKSVHAEVKGTSDLPDELLVTIPVYNTPGERQVESIRCSIDLDPQRSEILMRPLPGELSIALENRQRQMQSTLLDVTERVYWGTP